MKKYALFILILVSVISLFVNTDVWADYQGDEYIDFGEVKRIPVVDLDEIPYGEKAINKLDRGVINTATFWLEIPAEVAKVSNEQNPAMGVTVGMVQGVCASVIRAGSGLFDTFTFFVPPYDKPVVKPEYAFNRADREIQKLLW